MGAGAKAMKLRVLVLGSVGLCVLVCACTGQGLRGRHLLRDVSASDLEGEPHSGRSGARAVQQQVLKHNGLTRRYLVQPANGKALAPIVILLHGGTQDADKVWKQTSLPQLAQRERFTLVAPDGIDGQWNDGRGSTVSGNVSSADDVGFLTALIEDVVAKFGGDRERVFMVGGSNGGLMTIRYACEQGHRLRAAGNVISNLSVSQANNCPSIARLPWLSVNGTDDRLFPLEGTASGGSGRRAIPGMLSADQTFNYFAEKAGCDRSIQAGRLPGGSADDWAEKRTRGPCVRGGISTQYILHGSGHTWPGMRNTIGVRMLGGSSSAVDAGEIIWEHFRSTL